MSDKDGLSTDLIRHYLTSRGWTKKSESPLIEIYEKTKDEKRDQVYLPKDTSLSDYRYSINLLIKDLGINESRDTAAIVADMLQPKKDTISVSLRSADTQSGTMVFDSAIMILNNLRKALAAVAYSMDNQETVYPHPYNKQIEGFLQNCRLAQTAIGSYVINVECPTEHIVQLTLNEEKKETEENFGRKTTKRFMESIAYLKSITDKSTIEDKKIELPRHIAPGISANLCEAISNLQPDGNNFSVNIRMNWAKGVPIVEPKDSEITFQKYHLDAIYELGEQLNPQKPSVVREFIGHVSVLKGEAHDKRVYGEVGLTLIDRGEIIKVKVDLPRADYVLATMCHAQNKTIIIKGKLERESPRILRIAKYEYFRQLK